MRSFAFAALASAAAAISADELEFANYVARFSKVYEDMKEFAVRLERFKHHHKIINEHNTSGSKNFKLGHNQFSDWTDKEYMAILNHKMPVPKIVENNQSENEVFDFDESDLPEYVNWVEKGGVTPVKD